MSFSPNDAVGHPWGPNSQEVLDVSLRADFVVANLLRFLDANVGAGQYSVVVTADHGVCPMPEVSKGQDIDAKRVPFVNVVRGAELFLHERYGKGANPLSGGKKAPQWLESVDPPFIYFNARLIEAKRLDREAVARALGEWMQTQEGIACTFTRGQLAGEFAPDDDLAQRMRKSFHPDRCRDVAFVIEPYHLLGSGTGTTHGTPYPYDTHVPLLAYGPGVLGGRRTEAVVPQQAAVLTANFLGIPPRDCEYALPTTLYRQ